MEGRACIDVDWTETPIGFAWSGASLFPDALEGVRTPGIGMEAQPGPNQFVARSVFAATRRPTRIATKSPAKTISYPI